MTTLSDRPNTALMVIDVQKGPVAHAHQRDAVVANISALVDKAPGSTSRSRHALSQNRWCTSRSATPSRTPTWTRCWPRPGSDACS
jgi:nicotinamidase-related amidase